MDLPRSWHAITGHSDPTLFGTATEMIRAASGIVASRHAIDGLEEALLRPMVLCLLHGEARKESKPRGRSAALTRTFEAAVEQSATVTGITMSHGVWEPGRFAVAYKSLFGESPSTTLRRSFRFNLRAGSASPQNRHGRT